MKIFLASQIGLIVMTLVISSVTKKYFHKPNFTSILFVAGGSLLIEIGVLYLYSMGYRWWKKPPSVEILDAYPERIIIEAELPQPSPQFKNLILPSPL